MKGRALEHARLALGSLSVRNYRLYFLGQVVSVSGNWMQQIAIAWLVLRLTNSAFELGATTAVQTAPYLVLGIWGGLITDRFSKRRLLVVTQTLQVVPPILLFALTQAGAVRLWMIYAIVFARGIVNTVDNPARQSFVVEMVGRERIVNAVSLNASVIQAGRLLGPAVAAAVIATLGLGTCFLLNSLTFVFMLLMLGLMRPKDLLPVPVARRGRDQVRAGISLALRTPSLRLPLMLMAVIGLFSFNFTVVLPAVARFSYHGTPTTYALLMNFLALGAFGGALVTGTRAALTPRIVAAAGCAFGVALALAAAAPTLILALVAMLAVGATSVAFSASCQATVQLSVAPEMRGRILAIYQLLYMGTTPFGALIMGGLAASVGPRSDLLVGGIAALVAGLAGLLLTGGFRQAIGFRHPGTDPGLS